ncbi:imm11 family protein [Stenotrophomonas oahuensis]|uniref:DUF1629 domain-containing protein n=1 Tax=Stenotrophomonas oahuensis TaxID=3003271 RepID=A0ABY9YUB6_9GAMM|nr:DUF1629 domain-containing protein [Stenotrophomonas sp. A5586]WNH54507.1 DUF1629 domain-containing protein [Stenotrophomonas sp. A5586]
MSETTIVNQPRVGEYYIINPDFDVAPHEVEFSNKEALRPPGGGIIRPRTGGFPKFSETPVMTDLAPEGSLHDFQVAFEGYWLVSERLKRVFEAVDPSGFLFVQCELIRFDGSTGPLHYLCDVCRILDAVDENASEVKVLTEGFPNGRFYDLAGGARLAFRKDVVKDAHIFRSPFNGAMIVCDRIMRDALVEHGFGVYGGDSGMALDDAADY